MEPRDESPPRAGRVPVRLLTLAWLPAVALLAACSRPAPPPEPVRAVRTLTVGTQAEGGRIDYAGEVRARTESRLSFRVGGLMVRRAVNVGDSVKPGQLLASLDPQDLRLGQDAAGAALQAARVNAEQAGAEFMRFSELRAQGFISAAELERRENTYKAAQAQAQRAQAQAGVQGNQARFGQLVADVAGVVTAVEAEPGAVLAAGAPVLRLAHDGPRDVVFAVPEQQASAMRALLGRAGALQVRLVDSAGSVPAMVREVAVTADAATRTFAVKADVGRARAQPGQSATVSLAMPPGAGGFKLPLAAVFERQGRPSVWLLDKPTMTVRLQPVVVAGTEGNTVLVQSGLEAGQTVVGAGVHTLTAGQKVSLWAATGTR